MEHVDIEILPLEVYAEDVARICDPENKLRDHLRRVVNALEWHIRSLQIILNRLRPEERISDVAKFCAITRQDITRFRNILTHFMTSEAIFACMRENVPPEPYPSYYIRIPESATHDMPMPDVHEILNVIDTGVRYIYAHFHDVHACIPLLHLRRYLRGAYDK
jgi:hypothetical protein